MSEEWNEEDAMALALKLSIEGKAVTSSVELDSSSDVEAQAAVDQSIATIFRYRTGGDGGAALKLLNTFLTNILQHPDDPKYRSINPESATFKSKLGALVGPTQLLKAVGFEKSAEDGKWKYHGNGIASILLYAQEKLTTAEQQYIKENQPKPLPSVSTAITPTTATNNGPVPAVSTWANNWFGATLLTKQGIQPTNNILGGKRRIGIYFSAHWVKS
jgi:hypothetical protein